MKRSLSFVQLLVSSHFSCQDCVDSIIFIQICGRWNFQEFLMDRVLLRTGLRANEPLVHFQVVNRLVTGKSLAIPWLAAELVGPADSILAVYSWYTSEHVLPISKLELHIHTAWCLVLPIILQLQTGPKIAFLQAFGVILVVTLPSRQGQRTAVVHKAECVTDTRQKVWPPLRFLTMTSFHSVTHHWDGRLTTVCEGQP